MQNTDSPPPPPGHPPQSEQQGQRKRAPKPQAWEGMTEEQMKGADFKQNNNLTVFQTKWLWDQKTCYFCLRPLDDCFPHRVQGRCLTKAKPTDAAVQQQLATKDFPAKK